MPYFYWQGIDLEGNIHTGNQFARSINDLDNYLITNNIGLIKAKESRIYLIKFYISKKHINDCINHISILLKAGVRIYKAINIVSDSTKNKHLKLILKDIANNIYYGLSFSQALKMHKNVFDNLTISVIQAGENSSNLTNAIEKLDKHNKVLDEFIKKIKIMLLLPTLTFILFIIIVISLLIFIIPQFETFFNNLKATDMPNITRIVLSLSRGLRSKALFYLPLIFVGFYLIIKLFKFNSSKYFKDKLSLKMPIVSNILTIFYLSKFLQLLNLLLSSNLTLANSLEIIQNSIDNLYIKEQVQNLLNTIKSGKELSYGIENIDILKNDEIIELVKVGESSGDLTFVINQASELYQTRVYNSMSKGILLIQPLLLIILGCLIGMLILSVYSPLFTLSSIIY